MYLFIKGWHIYFISQVINSNWFQTHENIEKNWYEKNMKFSSNKQWSLSQQEKIKSWYNSLILISHKIKEIHGIIAKA